MAGEAVVERGRGTETPGSGDGPLERGNAMERVLCGVEFVGDDAGEGVVRVSEGVRARARGLRNATFRNLSKGDA